MATPSSGQPGVFPIGEQKLFDTPIHDSKNEHQAKPNSMKIWTEVVNMGWPSLPLDDQPEFRNITKQEKNYSAGEKNGGSTSSVILPLLPKRYDKGCYLHLDIAHLSDMFLPACKKEMTICRINDPAYKPH